MQEVVDNLLRTAMEGLEEVRAEQLAGRLAAAGLLPGLRPAGCEPAGSGARPWAHRLRLTTFDAINHNQHLGVRYVAVFGLAGSPGPVPMMSDPDSVLIELRTRGAVLAYLPFPAWAVALCVGSTEPELAWLTPLPLATRSGPRR